MMWFFKTSTGNFVIFRDHSKSGSASGSHMPHPFSPRQARQGRAIKEIPKRYFRSVRE